MEVKVGGRGRTTREDFTTMRSSGDKSSPVTGSLPFSSMYFSIRRFSKTAPRKGASVSWENCLSSDGIYDKTYLIT